MFDNKTFEKTWVNNAEYELQLKKQFMWNITMCLLSHTRKAIGLHLCEWSDIYAYI